MQKNLEICLMRRKSSNLAETNESDDFPKMENTIQLRQFWGSIDCIALGVKIDGPYNQART